MYKWLHHWYTNWDEPEQAPHWQWSVMVSYVACTDCENNKIWLTSYTVFNVSCRVYRLWVLRGRWSEGRRGLDDEENVTNLKKRETNEERQTRLVNLCRHLHISVMALHTNWLGKKWMIELDVQSSEKGQGRESLQSPLILLYSVVAIIIIYAITHTDYTICKKM